MATTTRMRWGLALVLLLLSLTGRAPAKPPDDQGQDDKSDCRQFSGGAFGLCNAFCSAQDCESERGGSNACASLRRNFERLTGRNVFPCEVFPVGNNKSGPIAITADGRKVVAVNTDTDTVSFFEVGGNGLLTKVREVPVGNEPRSVATLLAKPLAYVANTVSGTVSVID